MAKGANEENKLNALTASLARFNKNVGLADKGQLESIIIVGKCYRDGDGVQKDLSKAREYFQKASDMGSEEGAKLLASIP